MDNSTTRLDLELQAIEPEPVRQYTDGDWCWWCRTWHDEQSEV